MDWLGTLGLVIALVTAIGSIWYNWRRSRVEVRQQQFSELAETVRVQGEELTRTRQELRTTRAELQSAEQKIEALREENRSLRADLQAAEGKIASLEAENRSLRRQVNGARPV